MLPFVRVPGQGSVLEARTSADSKQSVCVSDLITAADKEFEACLETVEGVAIEIDIIPFFEFGVYICSGLAV